MTACINAGVNGCMRHAAYADGWCGECLPIRNLITGQYAKEDSMISRTVAHKVSADELQQYASWHVVASSTTADRTQRKSLWGLVGERRWKVERRYHQPVPAGVKPSELVYDGDDLREAVRLYNGLG